MILFIVLRQMYAIKYETDKTVSL